MTGQVKEDILTRLGELGVVMIEGKLLFKPTLLHKSEFLTQDTEATFIQVDGTKKSMTLVKDSLAFTVCQVPVVYKIATTNEIDLIYNNGVKETLKTLELNKEQSAKIFNRTTEISNVIVRLKEEYLR
jgi:hypothetical protein